MRVAMKFLWLVCFCGLTFLQAIAGQDSEEAWVILQKSAEAARGLNYRGIVNCQSGIRVQSMQLTHLNNADGEFSRMVVLDAPPKEMLSPDGSVVIYSPIREKLVIEKRHGQHLFPALLPANMDMVRAGYQARIGGQDQIAGRDVQIVFLDPRDRYRYGYKLWADREFGLLLKSMMLNERNEAIEQIGFNQLTLMSGGISDWFLSRDEGSKGGARETAMPNQGSSYWLVGQLPAGYRKVDQMKRMVPGKRVPVDHIIFSDGLASVSVFIEPLTKGLRARTGFTSMGATSFYANIAEGYQVVAVGDVPEATVTEIARAVSIQK